MVIEYRLRQCLHYTKKKPNEVVGLCSCLVGIGLAPVVFTYAY